MTQKAKEELYLKKGQEIKLWKPFTKWGEKDNEYRKNKFVMKKLKD